MVLSLILTVFVFGGAQPPTDSTHCVAAARFLRVDRHMVAAIDRDTINDWRTQQRVAGCRITAAGGTDIGVAKEAVRLYERLRAAHWTRTPDPRDAPNEASLRFRWEQSDCLFNVNAEALLNTTAEDLVNDALVLKLGETRYQVFVMCMPALPARPDHLPPEGDLEPPGTSGLRTNATAITPL